MSPEPFAYRERIAIRPDSPENPDVLVDLERYRFACRYVGGKKVLDIACGAGYGSHLLLHDGKATSVVGVDNSAETVKAARTNYASARLKFDLGTAEGIPLSNGSIEVAVSIETFEHLPNPALLLAELHRVLVPGGIAIISTPRNESPERVRPSNPFHLREYSWDEFGEIVQTVFPNFERWSQVTTYADPLIPSGLENLTNPIRQFLRKLLPEETRRRLRLAVGVPGLRPTDSRILPGMDRSATVQVVIGHKE